MHHTAVSARPQRSSREARSHLGWHEILVDYFCVLALLNVCDVLCDRGIGADPFAVHQRDELRLGQQRWRLCPALLQLEHGEGSR
jgi:hypothetical protein